MALGVLMTMPDMKQEQYERVNEEIFGRWPIESVDTPDGLIVHTAGPGQDGWYVYDVWETKEDFQRFDKEKITPAVKKVTGREFSDQHLQYFEIANLVPGALKVTKKLSRA